MKAKVLFVIIVCVSGIVASCTNNNQSTTDSCETKTRKIFEYNDKIQDTFFGVPLGASKKEVIDGFAKQDFYENDYSTDARLTFSKKNGRHGLEMEYYGFGGMNWKMLYVNLSNNRFQSIEFINAYKTKESALQAFDNVLSNVSAKYHMHDSPIDDTTSYKRYLGLTEDNRWVLVQCYSYESVRYVRWFGVVLAYGDDNLLDVSDEL